MSLGSITWCIQPARGEECVPGARGVSVAYSNPSFPASQDRSLKGERCDDTPPSGDLINRTGDNVLCGAFGLGKLGEHAVYEPGTALGGELLGEFNGLRHNDPDWHIGVSKFIQTKPQQ